MLSGTPPNASDYATLAGNVAKGVGKLPLDDVMYWNSHLSELHELIDLTLRRSPAFSADWVERMGTAENQFHRDFFGKEFNLALYYHTLQEYGEDMIRYWQSLGFEVHLLPGFIFTQDTDLPGWKVKPEQSYWDRLKAGKLKRADSEGILETMTHAILPCRAVLIDTHLKPNYKDGRQMFEEDGKMGQLIKSLRDSEKLAKYENGPQTSRFGISSRECNDHLRQAVAQLLKVNDRVDLSQVRLETAIEANTIPQIYTRMPRTRDGETNTSVWYEEYFGGESDRLGGGDSGYGGLASVCRGGVDGRWGSRAVRFLVEL